MYLREEEIMEIKKLTQILLGLGGLVTAGSIIWWASFYGQVIKERGHIPCFILDVVRN